MNRKKKTEKFALRAMAIVILWFIMLWTFISLIGCHNNCTHTIHEDNVMDSVEMDCGGEYHGKEGKSEYGEYNNN